VTSCERLRTPAAQPQSVEPTRPVDVTAPLEQDVMSPLPYGLSLDAVLVVGITLLITLAPILPPGGGVAASTGVALLTVVAWFKRCEAAAPVGVFCVVCLGLTISGVRYSQHVPAIGLLLYAGIVLRVPWIQGTAAGEGIGGIAGIRARKAQKLT